MADAWKRLNEKVKAKRTKKNQPKDHRRKDELTVQRLSAEVSGKAQKYTRIGPREFVPFDETEELTIGNIKSACERHFLQKIGKNLVCDILAGEQGPSCKTLAQIPDLKVVYARFIPDPADEGDVNSTQNSTRKRKDATGESSTYTEFNPPPSKSRSSPSKLMHSRQKLPTQAAGTKSTYYPRSLSISDMIKLGKISTNNATTIVRNFRFDMEVLSWSKVPTTVEFYEDKEAIGTGGFRKAFKATSKHPEFVATTWVIKHYLPSALKCISDTGQTIEQHNRKVVQMHLLARNFASQLEAEIKEESEVFGTAFRYRKIFHGETDEGEYVTVEEFIPGQFKKYVNNTGQTCVDPTDEMAQKAECLTHFTYERSKKKLMLVDIQGSGYYLFDPEIASTDLLDEGDKQYLYCTGNLSKVAISTFVKEHTCSLFCNLLGLPAIEN